MPRFPVDEHMISDETVTVTGSDYKHIVRVLRLRVGDQITMFDSRSREYDCVIEAVGKREVRAAIKKTRTVNTDPVLNITLMQGLARGDKMDYIVEKATELGVSRIVPVVTERSQIRETAKTGRWERIAVSASKQCGRTRPPEIENTLSFQEALNLSNNSELLIILHANTEGKLKEVIKKSLQNTTNIILFIGPEGGFSKEEILLASEIGFLPLGLGPRVLRTETASLAVLSVIQFTYGDL